MIILYRMDINEELPLPYRIIRYGGLQRERLVRSFEYRGEAEQVLDVLNQECEEIKQLERIDTLNSIRQDIFVALPTLRECQNAGTHINLSISAALAEISIRLRGKQP
jgi:hypothetical protein